MERLRRHAPTVLLGAALLVSAALLLELGSRLTFFQDTWAVLLHRSGFSADALLAPHNEHIYVIPVAVEKLLVEAFGMTSAAPERLTMTLLLSGSAAVLFVYVRRRADAWLALFAAVLLLFLGPAWQILLWPFQMGFVGSILCGVAMLLALEAGERRHDIAACIFLALSIVFSSLGIAFAAAAIVDVYQRRASLGLRRGYVPVVPLLLFTAWYLGWGHEAATSVSLRNVLDSPAYVLDGMAVSIESLLGLSTLTLEGVGEPGWGRPLLVALAVAVAYARLRGHVFSPRLWPVAAATASFWFLAAFNYIPGREPTSVRYSYSAAAFALLLAAELLRGVRLGRRTLVLLGVVTLAAVGPNLVRLKDGSRWLEAQTVYTRSDLAAIEIARRTVDPSFVLSPDVAGTGSLPDIRADLYLEAVREHGSPAYSPAELSSAPEFGRRQADIVLSRALPLSTEVIGDGPPSRKGDCTEVAPGAGGPGFPLSHGVTRIETPPGPGASLLLRRFALDQFPVTTGEVPGESTTLLTIPRDLAARPWRLRVEGGQSVAVCRGIG